MPAATLAPTLAPTASPITRPAPPPATVAPMAKEEPPPWMDDAPWADEGGEAAVAPAVEPAAPVAAPTAPPAPSARAAAVPVARTALGDHWAALTQAMTDAGLIVALVRELAMQAELTAMPAAAADGTWALRVERETLRTTPLRDRLQQALATHLGQPVQLQVEPGTATDSPALREAEARALAQREAEQIIQDDPAVRALMAQFPGARIVPGSIVPVIAPRNPAS